MAQDKRDSEPKQKTQPAQGKPVEIPVPKRDAVLRNLAKAANVSGGDEESPGLAKP